jgi:uncharacterized protein YndB with AHSA1/START domain
VAVTEGGPTRQGTVVLELVTAVAPDRVFAHYADLDLRRRWFAIPGDPASGRYALDFREGGDEDARGEFAVAGTLETIEYRARFHDIVPGRRIVFTSEVRVDGRRRSVSLTTVEILPHGSGTRLRSTEQYTLLDVAGDGEAEAAEREGGLRLQLNGLRSALQRDDPAT